MKMDTESKHIEFKAKLNDSLEKEAVAFLNTLGGVIYIGIDKAGKNTGIPDADQMQLQIKDRLKNNILPSCMGLFDIVIQKINEITRIKLIIAGGQEKPYYIKKYGLSEKGVFIRVGSASEPMPARMIETLFAKRTRNAIGKIVSPVQELRFEQLRIYYDSIGKPLNEQFARNLELLNDEGKYNYVAYLMSDTNGISVKTAKYSGTDRVDLIETNEFGYCSLVKATKQLLEKIALENKTITKITAKEREEKRLWNEIALREATINAIVHNDYTRETAPKIEFFADRLEITSYGGLPEGLNKEEFFQGISVPRNKEIMRIYKDLDLVEQLGSGVPRIIQVYNENCFYFSENFIRMIFPTIQQTTPPIPPQYPPGTPPVPPPVMDLVSVMEGEMGRFEMQNKLNLLNKKNFLISHLKPALECAFITMKFPETPNHPRQRYVLTEKGQNLKKNKKQ
jgi:predicted HTH transcriptional regulator